LLDLRLAGAFASVLLVAAPAHATVDDLLKNALALESQGRMAEAYTLLSPLTAERAGDADFDYALGLAASDTGHGGEALLAFQRVLAVQPGNAPARAELARVYAMTGDIDTAKAQFDTVVEDPSLPDPVRQRFNRIVRDLGREQQGGGTSVTGFAEISGGIDSNINTATNLTSITLPIFASLGPASLSGGATQQDSNFVGADAGISVASGVSRQDRAFA
jgi:tetratricopeptide (TPR) repeat protein